MLLLVAGVSAFLLGFVLWLFVRDLVTAALITMGIGFGLVVLAGLISWRQVGRAVVGRRGRYGVNTLVILIAFMGIAVLLNFFVFWLTDRPNPPGWMRIDTTANRQFALAPQALAVLDSMPEPVRANVFMTTSTPERAAAWRNTQDLLSEFARRSGNRFTYRLINPDLQPNVAADYGVTQSPAIAVEAMDSKRTEVIVGRNPTAGPNIFDEQSITTALLIVNRVSQKSVFFVTGHGQRTITEAQGGLDSYVQAAIALSRDNYRVGAGTLNDLLPNILSDNPNDFPAALIFANPTIDLKTDPDPLQDEEQILLTYMLSGGSVIFLFEPGPPQSFIELLGDWGLTVGQGRMVDAASYVAPDPTFLQITKANRQFGEHPITEPIDVVYMPGSTFVGRTVQDADIPLTETGEPYLRFSVLATTTLNSWEETSEELNYDSGTDRPGPLPVAVAVEALAPLGFQPQTQDGRPIRTNIVVIGDTDFASDRYFASAKNGDLLANSVNWAVRDFELISIRPKTTVFRELVLTRTERDFVRWTGWMLMPALISSIGVWVWWRRR